MEATQHLTRSERETEALAQQLASSLAPGTVIALDGELGAGKTCFVRGLARGLGIDPAQVSSPTFVIEHRYTAPAGKPQLVHIDAYRLKSAADLETIGWDELLAHSATTESPAIIAVEWAARIEAALPPKCIRITIEHAPDGGRVIRCTAPAIRAPRP